MDLSNLDVKKAASEGSVLELLHPVTGEVVKDEKDKPFSLTLIGSDSDTFKRSMRRNVEKRMNNKSKKVDLDSSEMDGINILASCTIDCYLILNGKKVDAKDISEVYKDFPWVREQAESFINDRANFIKS